MVGLNVASRFPKWQMVPWGGKTPVSWEGHEPEEKQTLTVPEEDPWESEQVGFARAVWAQPTLLRGAVPMDAELAVCRRGEES